MYKTIGILGGMGPAATADLMIKIIEMTDAASDQDHIPMLVDSNTAIPDRTAAIKGEGPSPVAEMLRSAERLEAGGADFLIIPCNTAHHFVPEIRDKISVPIVEMPAETAKLLRQRGINKAAVLATEGTCLCGIYDRALGDLGIEAMYPDAGQQELVMSLIYDFIKKGITEPSMLPREEIADVVSDMRAKGAEAVLLACTELPLAFDIMDMHDEFFVDPTSVIAAAAVREAGAPVRGAGA